MGCFIKKIFQENINEQVHRQFVRFGKGKYTKRAVISMQKTSMIKVKSSFEYANDFVELVSELGNFIFSGIITSKESLNLENELEKNIEIVFGMTIEEYFDNFNQKLKTTDILWTKPSELSFYSGLGIPIIISPPIGSQEDFNKRWLLRVRAGVLQEDPKHTDEWLFDLLKGGRLAETALKGFIEVEKMGTFNIEKIISTLK